MELKEFIRETLIQISEGVAQAQKQLQGTGSYINPEGYHMKDSIRPGYDREFRHVQKVKMSISVSVTEGNERKAGIGVVSSLFSVGASDKNTESNAMSNRIEFEIPISLPVMDVDRRI